VHHYYVQTLWGFVQKRRRAIVHFLRVQEEMSVNWMKEKPPVPLWLAGVYCVTFIGRLGHTLRGIIRDGDPRWFWHVPASLGSVPGDAPGLQTARQGQDPDRRIESEADAEAELNGARPQLFALKAASSASIISVMICSKVVSGCQWSRRLALAALPTRG